MRGGLSYRKGVKRRGKPKTQKKAKAAKGRRSSPRRGRKVVEEELAPVSILTSEGTLRVDKSSLSISNAVDDTIGEAIGAVKGINYDEKSIPQVEEENLANPDEIAAAADNESNRSRSNARSRSRSIRSTSRKSMRGRKRTKSRSTSRGGKSARSSRSGAMFDVDMSLTRSKSSISNVSSAKSSKSTKSVKSIKSNISSKSAARPPTPRPPTPVSSTRGPIGRGKRGAGRKSILKTPRGGKKAAAPKGRGRRRKNNDAIEPALDLDFMRAQPSRSSTSNKPPSESLSRKSIAKASESEPKKKRGRKKKDAAAAAAAPPRKRAAAAPKGPKAPRKPRKVKSRGKSSDPATTFKSRVATFARSKPNRNIFARSPYPSGMPGSINTAPRLTKYSDYFNQKPRSSYTGDVGRSIYDRYGWAPDSYNNPDAF